MCATHRSRGFESPCPLQRFCRVPPIHHRCHLNRCGVSPGNPNKPRAIRGRRLSGLIALGILPASCCGQAGTQLNGAPLPCGKPEGAYDKANHRKTLAAHSQASPRRSADMRNVQSQGQGDASSRGRSHRRVSEWRRRRPRQPSGAVCVLSSSQNGAGLWIQRARQVRRTRTRSVVNAGKIEGRK